MDKKRSQILVEDIRPDENLHVINLLPIDSPLLLTDVVDAVRGLNESEYGQWGVRNNVATLKEYFYKDDEVDGNFSDVPVFRKNLIGVRKRIEIYP